MVALDDSRGLQALDPTAGTTRLVGLLEKGGPVGDGAEEPAHVDVVGRGGGEGPVEGAVLNFAVGRQVCLDSGVTAADLQLEVWGHPARLDGGDVGAGYLGHGVCVGEVTEMVSSALRPG